MFRMELHSHCAGVSPCASATPEQVIARYRAAGYHGLVSTNHVSPGTFSHMSEQPWEEKVRYFLTGYEGLCRAAGDDFPVLLGCEIFLGGNDYLVFGVTPQWLIHLGDPILLSLKELSDRIHADGLMIFQAHPFRYGCHLVRENLLDGIETYNAHKKHDSHNYLAALWRDVKQLRAISGSDFHDPDGYIGGGIETDFLIRDNETLLQTLRGGNYSLIQE